MTITNRKLLASNILQEYLHLLDIRSYGFYTVNDDMSLSEDINGLLEINAAAFHWSDYESMLGMVSDFRSDNPDEIKAEIIRVFFAEDDEITQDLINDAIDNLEAGESATLRA